MRLAPVKYAAERLFVHNCIKMLPGRVKILYHRQHFFYTKCNDMCYNTKYGYKVHGDAHAEIGRWAEYEMSILRLFRQQGDRFPPG